MKKGLQNKMKRKLYKSRENRVLCGVCGGLGEYFNLDPVIVRLILVVLCCVGFSGVIAYIVAALIIPEPPAVSEPPAASKAPIVSEAEVVSEQPVSSAEEDGEDE